MAAEPAAGPMRLRLERTATRFPGGRGPVLILLFSLSGYVALHLLLEAGLRLCWFRALTGINCPTCGLSRAFLALFRGRFLQAFLSNPFMLSFTLLVLLQLFSTVAFKRRLALEATARERKLLLAFFLALFLLNWAWLIFLAPLA
ncbi:MAG TPA: DUF2752 domain-containing protein [Candidatus Syntrophosphaera sp.]|nr:DUF2752 domain-containing protein [Candidatus Syntrophosphaera sp.]